MPPKNSHRPVCCWMNAEETCTSVASEEQLISLSALGPIFSANTLLSLIPRFRPLYRLSYYCDSKVHAWTSRIINQVQLRYRNAQPNLNAACAVPNAPSCCWGSHCHECHNFISVAVITLRSLLRPHYTLSYSCDSHTLAARYFYCGGPIAFRRPAIGGRVFRVFCSRLRGTHNHWGWRNACFQVFLQSVDLRATVAHSQSGLCWLGLGCAAPNASGLPLLCMLSQEWKMWKSTTGISWRLSATSCLSHSGGALALGSALRMLSTE